VNPFEAWVRIRAFDPIVPPEVFAKAQAKLDRSRRRRTAEELLASLRVLLRRHGSLSAALINRAHTTASVETYRKRFGSLTAAYAAIGYFAPRAERLTEPFEAERALQALRAAYARHGRLSAALINHDPQLFSADTYYNRFGSLTKAYELAGLPFRRGLLVAAAKRQQKMRAAIPET